MNLSSCSITKSELGFSISSLEEKVRRLSLFRSPSPPSFLRLLSLLSTRPAVPPTSEFQDPPARFPWPRSCSLQSPLRQGLTESALHTSFISDHRSAQDPCLHPLIAAGHGFMLDQVRSSPSPFKPRRQRLADFSSFFPFRRKESGPRLLPSSSKRLTKF